MNTHRLKGMVVILDGLGDRPNPILDGLTPLQHASTPYLNSLTKANQSGLMDPMFPGLPVDTHTGVGMLFGVPPLDAAQISRGPVEATGIGLDLNYGDLLFRANLVQVEKVKGKTVIKDRRAGRLIDSIDELCGALQQVDVGHEIEASLFPATHHRCVLRLRGPQLSSAISNTDPGGKNIHLGVLKSKAKIIDDIAAQHTCKAINTFTQHAIEALSNHPINVERKNNKLPQINGVICRGPGMHQEFKNLLSYLGLKTAVVAGESTIIGLSRLFNFTPISDDEFTSDEHTNLDKKLALAKEALGSHDLVYIHIKGTDTAAHNKNPKAKSDIITRFDQSLSKMKLDHIVIGICADHSTDSTRGEHTGDPVPVLIHNPTGRRDQVHSFDEIACASGSLGRITAQQFLSQVLDAMGWLSNFTSSDSEYFLTS